MRLTLRTLLAYLDDTLEPNEIKEIGQKVAESDAAQELIARIKQVTRRRRLTTPPPGGPNSKFDANTIAEYLDNELSSELVGELERTCLESDVHLAEVASCHQILTLVLGEPALVPPTARERMYGLVRGREAIPFRKARSREEAGDGEGGDHDDALLPGLPPSRGWLIWALPLAALLVLAALAIAVWQSLPPAAPAAVAAAKPDAEPPAPDAGKNAPAPPQNNPPPAPDQPMNPPPAPMTPMNPADNNPPPPPAPPADDRPRPPDAARVAVGAYLLPPREESSILVQRKAERRQDPTAWARLAPGKSYVYSTDELVSLPGYNSELALGRDGGAHVLLHGHVPQFSVHPIQDFFVESAVTLYQPPAGFDADLSLDHGRVFLSSRRAEGPVKVRLRFAGEVWDVTLLEPDTEVGVGLIQAYLPDPKDGEVHYLDEEPLRSLELYVFSGRAGVKVNTREFSNLTARALFLWDNKGSAGAPGADRPLLVPAKDWPLVQNVWSKTPPAGANQADSQAITQMRNALDDLSRLMREGKTVDDALMEARPRQSAENPMLRLLAVYSFGAIDNVDRVLDVLCTDESEAHAADRHAAVFALRRWIGRSLANGQRLYDVTKDGRGLLMDAHGLRASDAKTVFELLHDYAAQYRRAPATFDQLTSLLRSSSLPVRELAYWHLLNLSSGARVTLPPYNAAWGENAREPSVVAWKELIKHGDLPPPAPPPMAPPGQ